MIRRREPRNAKLTPEKVRQIRRRYKREPRPTQSSLAEEYGVTQMAISHLLTGKTWTGVK
jgi:hypothetical protein